MAVAPDSTSYPTLAVIQHFGLTAEAARAVWRRSDVLARLARMSPAAPAPEGLIHELGETVMDLGRLTGGAWPEIDEMLHANVVRALVWCWEHR